MMRSCRGPVVVGDCCGLHRNTTSVGTKPRLTVSSNPNQHWHQHQHVASIRLLHV